MASQCAFSLLVAGLFVTYANTAAQTPEPASPQRSIGYRTSSDFNALSEGERRVLAPLAGEWDSIEASRRAKWLEIAKRYPTMKPEDQRKAQERMREWAGMTPEQRRIARDSYAHALSLPPEKRAELLQKYQSLPEEKKQQLAAESKAHKSLLPVKSHVTSATTVPTKAQIKEGSRQRVPGLPHTVRPSETSAKKTEGILPIPKTSPALTTLVVLPGDTPNQGNASANSSTDRKTISP